MNNKYLGLTLIIIAIVFSIILISFKLAVNTLTDEVMAENEGVCFVDGECIHESLERPVETYVGGIIIGALLALGVYLLFFDQSQKEILSKQDKIAQLLYEKEQSQAREDKFFGLLAALDEEERRIMRVIKEEEGITQATLRYRVDMSKAKLSVILTDLERRGLLNRKESGKTYKLFIQS